MRIGQVTAGLPEPLGVTPTATGVNVAVASTSAEAIEICLFDPAGAEHRLRLPARTGAVFHGHVEGVGVGARYGLRAHGPWDPARGHRFDPAKLLVDPYARQLDGPFVLHPAMFSDPDQPADSAAVMPKAVVAPAPERAAPPRLVPWAETVIYEAHVRGLTRLHPDVPEAERGTFAALAHPAVIAHLKALGVTTLELLPTAAWIDERHLGPLGLTNYWGYNPVVFGAPDPRLAPGGWPEIRRATSALAEAGIETILDVVFNHTGEGDHLGPTLSLRGLDNAAWYWLRADDQTFYVDDSGTGDTLRLDTLQGVRLVTEAMRTWVRLGGVAGFRFDLATVLGRRTGGFDPAAPLLAAIEQDPELRGLKLIAEPWDCGPGGYQLGRFPGGWGEWNDRFRDVVRRFWRGDNLSLGEFASRIAGSQDVFGPRGRPSRSVNFVTAHDGFTLADLVAYAGKHNEANGEQNRDGTDNNSSWNNGVEGLTDEPAVLAARAADQRALLATLILARGTPMLSMGAELGQTQEGNNNAYAQDNATTWLDWAGGDADLRDFTARLIGLRAKAGALHEDRFLTGQAQASPWPDVSWLDLHGRPLTASAWDDPQGSSLQMVLSPAEGPGPRVAVVFHRGHEAADVRLPPARDGHDWRIAADSADPTRDLRLGDDALEIAPRSVVAVVEEPGGPPSRQASDEAVAELADAAGISREWWGLDGSRHAVSVETQRALLAAMDLPANGRDEVAEALWRLRQGAAAPLPACRVAREGEAVALPVGSPERWAEVDLEDGSSQPVRITDGEARLPPLPQGYHRLRIGSAEGRLIVAPAAAYEPEALARGARGFGLSAQLYTVPRASDGGIGDLTTLAELCGRASELGAGLVAINPLHALFPQDRSRASPYHPSDRRFIDPIYLDLAALPGGGVTLLSSEAIDYPAVWAAKAAALERITSEVLASGWQAEALDRFVAERGPALRDFALFQALAEVYPGAWSQWPVELRTPQGAEAAGFADAHADRIRHHQVLQWLCDRQLEAAVARGPALGICRDLAVGAAPDSAEAWSSAGRLALAASIGAPPDAFAPQGQVWALPPPKPRRWRAEGYDAFRELVAANMRHAGALRVDHVLGLARLFWVPEGAEGRDGAYVAYPERDLLGVLALESVRARCLVVGEDLGTVPDGLRDALHESRIYSYQVLPFERDGRAFRPPASYQPRAVACVSTHDLAPLAGWWSGEDLDERAGLGLIADGDLEAARAERLQDKAELLAALIEQGAAVADDPEQPYGPKLAAAIHAFVAAAPSRMVLVQLDDLAGEAVGVNLPGTDRERPNWRRRLALSLSEIGNTELSGAILGALAGRRPGGSEPQGVDRGEQAE